MSKKVLERHAWLPTGHETLACQVKGCGKRPEDGIHNDVWADRVRAAYAAAPHWSNVGVPTKRIA